MSRSTWKIPYVNNFLFSNFVKNKFILNFWKRNSIISNNLIGKKFRVYNGIWFLSVQIKSNMIGHKFGEFSFSKRMGRIIHFQKKKKK